MHFDDDKAQNRVNDAHYRENLKPSITSMNIYTKILCLELSISRNIRGNIILYLEK